MENNRTKIPLIVYTLYLILLIYTLKYQGKHVKKVSATKLGKIEQFEPLKKFTYCFYTIWNVISIIIFLLTSITNETLNMFKWPGERARKFINRVRSYHFHAFIAPCSIIVASMFWSLYIYDRNLIFPEALDPFLPLWCNHVMHTSILLPVFIELAMTEKKYNFIRFKSACRGFLIYMAVYETLYFSIYFKYNIFLYPISGKLTFVQTVYSNIMLLTYGVAVIWLSIYIRNRSKITTDNINATSSKSLKRIRFKEP